MALPYAPFPISLLECPSIPSSCTPASALFLAMRAHPFSVPPSPWTPFDPSSSQKSVSVNSAAPFLSAVARPAAFFQVRCCLRGKTPQQPTFLHFQKVPFWADVISNAARDSHVLPRERRAQRAESARCSGNSATTVRRAERATLETAGGRNAASIALKKA